MLRNCFIELSYLELKFLDKTQLKGFKLQFTDSETQFSVGKLNFEQDWELFYLKDIT